MPKVHFKTVEDMINVSRSTVYGIPGIIVPLHTWRDKNGTREDLHLVTATVVLQNSCVEKRLPHPMTEPGHRKTIGNLLIQTTSKVDWSGIKSSIKCSQ